jgi:hypothetical protein
MDTEKTIVDRFTEGGWIVSLIGAGGMLARILHSNTKYSIGAYVRKILAAGISSSIAWFVLEQSDFSSFTKALIYGIVGVVSPEVIEGVILIFRKFFEKPQVIIDFILRR